MSRLLRTLTPVLAIAAGLAAAADGHLLAAALMQAATGALMLVPIARDAARG